MNIIVRLEARSSLGEAALRKYYSERLTLRERSMALTIGLKERRVVDSEFPYCVLTTLYLSGLSKKMMQGRFDYWREENVKVVEAKMESYGASADDYRMSVEVQNGG